LNLLTNAIKFTARGSVTLRLIQHNGSLRFEVADTGIGIPQDQQHLLFQHFSQAGRSTTRNYGGTGLGLSICKRLVELMGGAIGVQSQVGLGSTFLFPIPVAIKDPARDTAVVVRPADVNAAKVLAAEDLPMNQIVIGG